LLKDGARIAEIAGGLTSTDAKLVGDCAEVMTMIAAEKPKAVAPFADKLIARLDDKNTRVRWEAMHSLAEIAATVPGQVAPIVPRLEEKIASDQSVIVRDYAVTALGEYGSTSPAAAQRVWPSLHKALVAWDGKQAGKALVAMQKLVAVDSSLRGDARKTAERFLEDPSPTVRAAAKRLLRLIGESVTNDDAPA
jgi:HEAT repeat protein